MSLPMRMPLAGPPLTDPFVVSMSTSPDGNGASAWWLAGQNG